MANQKLVGRVGQTTYYVRKSEQVARQARNNSNYGDGASRTTSQLTRRVRWSNLVNLYKVFKFWMPKAFEGLTGGVTVYNKFMQLNINESSVSFTKSEAAAGASVIEGVWVSQGQLPSIDFSAEGSLRQFIVNVTDGIIGEGKTLGELSQDIIDNNPDFLDGDNIALVAFSNTEDSNGVPHARCRYYEVTLDTTSTALVTSLPIVSEAALTTEDGHLAVTPGAAYYNDGGSVMIHTRKVNGRLLVSSQQIQFMDISVLGNWISATQREKAIASYGVDAAVPLDPGF